LTEASIQKQQRCFTTLHREGCPRDYYWCANHSIETQAT